MWMMIRTLNLRHLRQQWLRTILALLGVAMGVATFVFVPALGANLQDSLTLSTDDIAGSSSVEIHAKQAGFSADVLEAVRKTDGIELAAPLATGGGLVLGQPELLVFLGIDPLVDRDIRTYTLTAGNFLAAQSDILITQTYATEKKLFLGDTLTLISGGGVRVLNVVGILDDSAGVARVNSGDLVVMGLEDAYALRGVQKLDIISIRPTASLRPNDLITQMTPQFETDDLSLGAPSDRVKSQQDFMRVVQMLLSVVSLMILAAGSSLIYNTITVSIAQRRSEIGILRALGMSQVAIRRLYIFEAGALGFIGSVMGVLIGSGMVGIGQNMELIPAEFVETTLRSEAVLQVPVWAIPLALVVGTLIPMAAGYFASRAATQVDPVEAMVQIRAEVGQLTPGRWRVWVAGLIVLVLILIRTQLHENLPLIVVLGNIGLFLAMAVGFLVYAPIMVMLGDRLPSFMQRMGATGLIASSNVMRRPKRIVLTGLLLLYGVMIGMFIGMSNFGYTESTQMWQNGENFAALTVTGAGTNPFQPMLALLEQVVSDIANDPQVTGIVTENLTSFKQDGTPYDLRALDIAQFRALGGAFGWQAGDESTAYTRLMDHEHPAILVSMGFVTVGKGLTPGSTLTLKTPQGNVTFEVVGNILGGMNTNGAPIVMDKALYETLWQDPSIDRVLVQVQPGTDVQALRRDWLARYALQGVITYDNVEMRQAFIGRISNISNVSSLLTNLCVVIILAGIISTFYVLVLDRRREIGLLRALGFLRHQIVQGMLLEALILLGLAIVIGVPCAVLAVQMQQMAMQNLMGLVFALNPREVILILMFCIVSVLISTYLPARAAGQVDVLEAMRYE